MLFEEQENNLMVEAKQTLAKLQNEKNSQKDLLSEFRKNWSKYDKGRAYFEEYTVEAFQSKMKVDLLYMEQLLQKLDNEQITEVEKLISSLYRDVKEIYEFMNIKPEMYGKSVNEQLINENSEKIRSTLSKNIYNYLSKNFYDMPLEKREETYFERVKEDSKNLITEGIEGAEAVEYSIKKCLMEDLVNNICFPFVAKSRLNYLLEDKAFGDLFDQNALREAYDSFNQKKSNISRIIAACV